ncbi:MAG: hypothetical protein WCT23_01735 [Candidatus Neomarinimicrobiota bacterium]|jgi:hypothetical protein
MKFFKILATVLLACIVLFFIVGSFLPKTATFEKEYTVDAPADLVEKKILDLYEDHLWPIWDSEDTSIVYTDFPGELGYTWEGDKVGLGECIVNIKTDMSIEDIITYQGQEMAKTLWQIIPGEKTKIRISFTVFADKNISARWTNLFLDNLMGNEFNQIITEMKTTLENTKF